MANVRRRLDFSDSDSSPDVSPIPRSPSYLPSSPPVVRRSDLSTDSEGTIDTIEVNYPEERQRIANQIKDYVKVLQVPRMERIEAERQHMIRLGDDPNEVRDTPISDFDNVVPTESQLKEDIINEISDIRYYIPVLEYLGYDHDETDVVRRVLLNSSFRELFSDDEFVQLKEAVGMENLSAADIDIPSGGRRAHKTRKRTSKKHARKSRSKSSRKSGKGGSKKHTRKSRKSGTKKHSRKPRKAGRTTKRRR